MAYLGLQPQTKTVATSTQQLSGNGVDLEFSLNRAVSKAADILVFVGTTAMVPETQYTAYDNTLLFVNAPASGTNNISVNYKAGALSTVYVSANAYPVGTTTNPSIHSVDAAATGIWFPTINSLGFTVSGNTRVTVSDVSAGVASSTTTGALRVQGGVGVTGAAFLGGKLTVLDTTESTSSNVGAVVISGGLGVAKDTYIAGQLQVAGDFTVAGQFTTTGSDSLAVNDPFVFLANANPGDNLDSGFVSSYYDGSNTRYTGLFRDITDSQYKLFSNLLVQPTTTVDTGNVSYTMANLIVGNIIADNVYGTVQSASTITAVGNLVSLSVAGTTSMYNIAYVYANNASSSTTSGALQVRGGAGIAGNLYAGNVQGTNLTGTLLTASQPNITTLAGVTSIGASGSTQLTGLLQTAAQTNITSVGTLTGLTVNGTASATTFSGAGTSLTGTASSLSIGGSAPAGSLTGSTLASGVTASSLTSVGTLTSLNVGGTCSVTSTLTINSTNQVTAIANGGTSGVGNIGASGATFNTAFIKSTSAQYADVAERYLADAAYEPGTVLHFGGEYEVSQCNVDHCSKVAGIVSTNPAYLMNSELNGEHVVDLALLGRVPCKVVGAVSRGDMIVSAGNGYARSEANPKPGAVIGKALQDFDGTEGVIEVVVGRV